MNENLIDSVEISGVPQEANGALISETPRLMASDNTNRNFKGQQKNEVVYSFSRRHWIVLLPHLVGFFVFLAAIAGFFIIEPASTLRSLFGAAGYPVGMLLAICALTVYLHRFFIRIFNYYLQIFVITNFRIVQIQQTLYFTRNRDSVDLHEIQNVELHQKGLLPTVLNYGNLVITLSSAYSTKTIYNVPNPEYYFRKINKTQRQSVESRASARPPAMAKETTKL